MRSIRNLTLFLVYVRVIDANTPVCFKRKSLQQSTKHLSVNVAVFNSTNLSVTVVASIYTHNSCSTERKKKIPKIRRLTKRWCTANDFTTSFLHFSLFSTVVWDLAYSRPFHSLMLSSHLFFFCLPCRLSPFIVPCTTTRTRTTAANKST